jgi:protein-S-isoprenylcysteine O-methyltransferase Ste14
MPKQDNATTAKHPRIRTKHLLVYSSIFIVVPILTFIIGRVLDNIFLLPNFPPFPINIILGSAIFFLGLAIGIKATRTLFKEGQGLPWGELNGRSQTKTLVTNGIYAYTRNPMVLGYSLLPCGMGIMFRSISMTVLITATTLFASAWVARNREEPSLEKRFGEAYSEYKKNTPFLIPRLKTLLVRFTRLLLATTKEGSVDELARVRNVQVVFYSISLLSLSILAALALTAQPVGVQVQKEAIGAAFGAICMLGIIAGISPSRCNQLLMHVQTNEIGHKERENTTREKTGISFIGHHPNCGSFSSHVIQIGGRIYCAGCVGLVVGATIALVGTVCYVVLQSLSAQLVLVMFWSGLAGVTLGLLQYELFIHKASFHFLLNVIFVVGAFLLLVGVSEMNGSLSLGIYFLLVILFLINVRSTLSRLEHEKKCAICSVEDCSMK